MHISLKPFLDLAEQGLIRIAETDDLVTFNYTAKCVYDRAWGEFTLKARGTVYQKASGLVVARSFDKFFNIGEIQEPLPNMPYVVFDKIDGTLIIIYHYKGRWRVNTRGSFDNEMTREATRLIKEKYFLAHIPKEVTLLAELIYPNNRNIVDYASRRELVLLASFLPDGQECFLTNSHNSFLSQMPLSNKAEHRHLSIEQMVALQKTMPIDQEGFVVRFENGLRIKDQGRRIYARGKDSGQSLTIVCLAGYGARNSSKEVCVPTSRRVSQRS